MASMETPWADLVKVTVEIKVPTPGAAWSPVNCDVSSLHAAGGRAEWSGQVDPSVMSATLVNVKGTVKIPAGSMCRVSLGHAQQIFHGRVSTAVRSASPGGYSTITIHAVDDLGSLATTYLDDPRDHVEPWDRAKAYQVGAVVGNDDEYWKATKASTGQEPGQSGVTAWALMTDAEFADGKGDTFKERCTRILDKAGWPTADRNLDDTLTWDLEGTWYGRTALEELKTAAQSVGAWVYLSRDGKISTGFPDDQGAPTWTIYAEASPADHDPVCASAFRQSDSLEHVVNDVYLSHHGGSAYVQASDLASQTAYGVRSYMQADLQNLAYLNDLASQILAHGKDPQERLQSVSLPITTQQTASLLDQFTIGERLRLIYDNGYGDSLDELEGFVVGWRLDLDTSRAMLTLSTGHPLDVTVKTVPHATATGGGGSTGGSTGPQGPTGPTGPRGTMWFEGPNPPTASSPPAPTGGYMLGDAYLDTTNGELYLYQATGWSDSGVSLIGPEGPRGIQGIQGSPGTRGTQWSHGPTTPGQPHVPPGGWIKGDVWLHETDGELFLYSGTTWSDEGFSIKGTQGIQGPAGHKGDPGATGHEGPTGPHGPTGPRGQGLEFLTAVATVGDLPAIGHTGGLVGDVHLVVADGNLYTPHNGSWVNIGHVQGPPGPKGSPGAKGDPGHIGHTGPAGHAGTDGKTGPRGAHGAPGVQGHKGDTGAQGPIGPQGPRGQISDAHGDARYLRLDTANDPLKGNLDLGNYGLQRVAEIQGKAGRIAIPAEATMSKLRTTAAKSFADWQVRNIWIGGSAPAHKTVGDLWFET